MNHNYTTEDTERAIRVKAKIRVKDRAIDAIPDDEFVSLYMSSLMKGVQSAKDSQKQNKSTEIVSIVCLLVLILIGLLWGGSMGIIVSIASIFIIAFLIIRNYRTRTAFNDKEFVIGLHEQMEGAISDELLSLAKARGLQMNTLQAFCSPL
ncbi:hypothetical protein N9850_13645 [Granulosicoccus sp.]|nr:hypothetical protein [Granulosicoccus sp.]MDB4224808.1 hypothetical protein [Granulosicoccus sp.]